jgi:ABC-2 type transport system permease protein
MTDKSITQAFSAELSALRRSRWETALAVWLPALMVVVLWAIFSSGLPRELPIAVVDLDHSALSRKLVRYLDASPALRVVESFSSVHAAQASIQNGEVYALISVPIDLERDVYRGESPAVTAFFNAQYLLVANLISSTMLEIETNIAVELGVAQTLPKMPVFEAAMAISMPVRAQITPLYNSNLSYARFLLPGIIAALFQVVICSITVLSIGRSFQPGHVRDWSADGAWKVLIGKLLPYTIVYFIYGLLVLGFFFVTLNWPLQGTLLPLIPAVLLSVLASQSLGALFFMLAFQLERALSVAGAFCAPAFAFLGVTFPQSDMSRFAAFWRELMPASHYLDAYVYQTSYAAGWAAQLRPSLILLCFCLLLPLCVSLIKFRLRRIDDQVYSTA